MNKRPDLDNIHLMTKEKKMSIKEAKTWLALPYFDIPFHSSNKTEFDLYADAALTEKSMNEMIASFRSEPFYFRLFVGTISGWLFKVDMSEDGLTFNIALIPLKNGKALNVLEFVIKTAVDDPTGAYFSTNHTTTKQILRVAPAEERTLFEMGHLTLARLAVFRDYNNQKDNYLVKVAEEKKPRVKGIPTVKEQLQRVVGPSILYLNRLPGGGGESAGECAEKRPHQRRGTWVTLRAERYRFHPKYQVEKGVYRKPAWVGPKEAIVEGNIYTILE